MQVSFEQWMRKEERNQLIQSCVAAGCSAEFVCTSNLYRVVMVLCVTADRQLQMAVGPNQTTIWFDTHVSVETHPYQSGVCTDQMGRRLQALRLLE